ncbi:hypothetical protein LINPERPRIM_LOCUS14823, partial [Linum perenne]
TPITHIIHITPKQHIAFNSSNTHSIKPSNLTYHPHHPKTTHSIQFIQHS